jgi:alkylation response protein AidB-like acyl-CoA dehydrogenase
MSVMRHPIFTAEHDELRAAVRRFVATEVRPHVEAWERAGSFPDALFRRCGELGFLGLHYPTRWGGSGGDLAAGVGRVNGVKRFITTAIAKHQVIAHKLAGVPTDEA